MKCAKALFTILMVCLVKNNGAAPMSNPQNVVNVVRTSNGFGAPLTQFRVVPFNGQHVSHLGHDIRAHPAHTFQTLRTVPSHHIQAVRTVPAAHTVQAVRTIPAQGVHALHNLPPQTFVHAAPVPVRTAVVAQPAEAVGVAQYSFGYSVADTKTGDSKTRQETRNGDVTTGSYSVADPDGRIRTVTYTADAVHGFQAHVTYDGVEGPPAIAINAPATAVVESSASPTVISAARDPVVAEPVAETERTSKSLFDDAVQRVEVANPLTTVEAVRTVPTVVRSNAVHAVHTAPVVSHAFPTAVHQIHAVPQTVRAVASPTASHVFHQSHAFPTAVHQIHAVPQTVRAVASPTASHVVHHSDHSTPTATVLRSVSPNVLHFQTASGLRSVPIVGHSTNPFGTAQVLRAVNTFPSTATHLVHA